jgi:hypothetical protein
VLPPTTHYSRKSGGVRQTADLVAAPLRPREPDTYFLFAVQFDVYGLFCCIRATKAAQDQVGDDVGYGVCEFFPGRAPA